MSAEQRLRDLLEGDAATLGPAQVEHQLAAVQTRARRNRRRTVALRTTALAGAAAVTVGVAVVAGWVPRPGDEGPVAPAAPAAGPLVGEYVVDVPTTTESEALGLAGRWVARVEPDGQLVLTPPSTRAGGVSGSALRVDGDRIETNVLSNVPGCQAGPGVGTYEWATTSGGARFEVVGSDCRGRELLFTATSWRRLP